MIDWTFVLPTYVVVYIVTLFRIRGVFPFRRASQSLVPFVIAMALCFLVIFFGTNAFLHTMGEFTFIDMRYLHTMGEFTFIDMR